jgi:hypothetical protein
MKTYKISLLILAGMLSVTGVFAQENRQKADSTIDSKNVDVVKKYKPKLQDAKKVDIVPADEKLTVKKPEITYKTPPSLFKTSPTKTKLSAPGLDRIPIPQLNRNYVKLGFGNYGTLYGDFFYNTLRNRTSMLAVQGKHFSGNGPVDSSRFSENKLDIFGKQLIGRRTTLTADLGYARNANQYYGKLPGGFDTLYSPSTLLKQTFNDIHAGGLIENTGADTGQFRYGAGVNFYNFTDKFKTSENDFTLYGYGIEPFRGNDIRVDVSYDFMRYKQSLEVMPKNRSLLLIDLRYNFRYDRFRASAGFKTATSSDSIGGPFNFFPDVKLETDVIDKYLTVYAGLTGGRYKTTYRGLAYENPFILTGPDLINEKDKLKLYGGAKGSFSSKTSFMLGVNYRMVQSMAFFLNDSLDPRKFQIVYDPSTTVFSLNGGFGLSLGENGGVNASFNVNNYTPSSTTLKHAYHKRAFDATLNGYYNIMDKIQVGGDVFFVGKRFGAVNAPVVADIKEYTLPSYVDVNTRVTYKFGELSAKSMGGLRAWLELKNILGNQYEYWNFYPVRGFQVMGGVSYSFGAGKK